MFNTIVEIIKGKDSKQLGFTLIEIAIVMVLIGLILAPTISIYHNYIVDKDWKETEDKLNLVVNEIGGFRSVYSRYPCPASATAPPGTTLAPGYGLENCAVNPVGTCIDGICTYASNIPGRVVVIGAIPFKTLNLQEFETYDAYGIRFRYAVTRDLTSSATFDMNNGGIGVVDKNGASIIAPPDTGHFVVLSHGVNKIGGYSRPGVQALRCIDAPLLEQENCDADAIFLSGEIESGFDDRIKFFSDVMPSEWQVSEDDRNDIHLKNTNSFAIGVNESSNLGLSEVKTVHTSTSLGDGVIRADSNFRSSLLCEYDANGVVDCFAPRLIAGSLNDDGVRLEAETTDGSGMSCYTPSDGGDRYLAGIANGQPVCVDEIFVTCPSGSFIKEINSDGNVVCDSVPDPRCMDMEITTTCGDDRTIEETYSGGYRHAYSGECRMITDYSGFHFEEVLEGMTLEEIEDYIETINSEERTIVDCGPEERDSLVRDTYRCNAGEWEHVSAHERRYAWSRYPSDFETSKDPWPAEISYTGDDPDNNNHYHDCWCREDYRVITPRCRGGLSGNRIVIQKHRCPQTVHHWSTIYDNDEFCECVPRTLVERQSCNSYYDEINGTTGTVGLEGEVVLTYDVRCEDGEEVISDDPLVEIDCRCASPDDDIEVRRTYCPTGYTNSWSWEGGEEVGVSELYISEWVCPDTSSGGLPDPGYWSDFTLYEPIPECVCDESITDIVVRDCPSELSGSGIRYEREWDCSINDWEPEEEWEEISRDCNSCSWSVPSGSASIEDAALGGPKKKVGRRCDCDEGIARFCWDNGPGEDNFYVWAGCQCTVQVD